MTHAERFAKACLHIKAGEYEQALRLYEDKEALPSEKRVVQRKVDYAIATVRHWNNPDKPVTK